VADLSDLAAQTDAFIRAQRPATVKDSSNGGSNASSPTTPVQTNRLSSYSSVVSSAARTVSQELPVTASGTAKPSVTSSGVDVGQRSSAAGLATGMCVKLHPSDNIIHQVYDRMMTDVRAIYVSVALVVLLNSKQGICI